MAGEAEDLLRELAVLATRIAPSVRPVTADRLLASIARTARELFGAHACSLALLSADNSELVYTTAAGEGAEDVTGMRLPVSRGIAGWVVASGQPVAIADLAADPRFARDVAEQTGYVPRALLAVPIADEQGILGVITLLDRDSSRPGAEQDMLLLSVFAEQAALTLRNERAAATLGRLLLTAFADAARQDRDLAAALDRVAADLDEEDSPDADLAELAQLLALLGRRGPRERRLAVRLAREVADYQPSARRGPR